VTVTHPVRKIARKALNGETPEDTRLKRKLANHVFCLCIGVFLGATGLWLHWSDMAAFVVPSTPNLAMEFTDFVAKL
jgi:hypothetical protein